MVLYVDGDFMIFDNLENLAGNGDDGVVLVPHVLSPVPRDGMQPDETTLLGSGMFNAGMFGVGIQHGGFLEFLMERLKRECIFDAKRMRFNEQRWLDFVPSLFPHRVVKDPGVDVAYWNLHERPLEKQGDRWLAGGVPLRAFHFSSFEPRVEGMAGRYELANAAPRVRLGADPLFAELCAEYRRMLYAEGLTDSQDPPFAFDMLPDGTPVYSTLRELFRARVLAADAGAVPIRLIPSTHWKWMLSGPGRAEQYAGAGLSVPRKMSEAASRPGRRVDREGVGCGPGAAMLGAWDRKRMLAPEPTPSWAVDILGRMVVDDAGETATRPASKYCLSEADSSATDPAHLSSRALTK